MSTAMQNEAVAASAPPPSGTQRAAQLLLVLGEDNAAQILRQLDQKEIQKLGAAMTGMNEVSTNEVGSVLDHFLHQYKSDNSIRVTADDFTRKVLVQALGEEQAIAVLSKISKGADTRALESLSTMEPQLIASIIQDEHPQIQALVVSYLPSAVAAAVLTAMPEEAFLEIVMRMASIESVDPMALGELNESLQMQVDGLVSKQSIATAGVKTVANLLNAMDAELEEKIMQGVRDSDSELAQSVQDQMYVFEDLLKIPDRDFQSVLRELATDLLAMAMKGADDELKDKVFRSMSSRAAEIFKDDMETLGPVKLSEVETAQKEILEIIKRLSDSGDITLSTDTAGMVE